MPAKPNIAELVAEALRDIARDGAPKPEPLDILRGSLFAQQRALIDDHAHPRRAACCSRRAGKTQGIIRGMLERCLSTPRSVCVYFAMTRDSAKKMVWTCPDGIPDLIESLGITEAITENSPNETDLLVKFKNGSVLWVSGIDTIADGKKWKGLRYDIVVLDEAQDWNDETLSYMVHTALSPALMDRKGEMLVTGTPGPYNAGLFYEVANGLRPNWGLHSWTCFENPHVENAREFVSDEAKSRGLTLDDPIMQREFFGRWVRDVSTLLFQYAPGRNDYQTLPAASEWRYVLGMDVGVVDLATYVLMAFRQYDPCVYVLEAHGEKAGPTTAPVSRFAEVIRGFQQKYGRDMRMVMDAGALAKGYQLELLNRYGLNVEAAKKTEKASAIRLMNDQFRLGLIKVGPGCGALTEQLQKLQIDPKTQIEKLNQPADYCLTGDALVATARGDVPIRAVVVGDRVWTRQGLKRVAASWCSGVRPVLDLTFSNGAELTCTPDHPLWDDTQHCMVDAWETTEKARFLYRSSTDESTSSTLAGSTSALVTGRFTEIPGSKLTVPSLPGTPSTTSTTTRSTIASRILRVCRAASISAVTCLSRTAKPGLGRTFTEQLLLRRRGTPQKQVAPGTPNTPGRLFMSKARQQDAVGVAKITARRLPVFDAVFALRNALRRTAELLAKTMLIDPAPSAGTHSASIATTSGFDVVALVRREQRTEPAMVYDLTVEDAHEFFANGILVSNCDAALYGWRDCYAYLAQPAPDDSKEGRERAMIERILANRARDNVSRELEQERREMGYAAHYEGD